MNVYSVIDDLNTQYFQENQRKSSSQLLTDCFIRNYLLIRCYSNNKNSLMFSNFKKKIIAKYNAQLSQVESQKMKKTFYQTKNILKKPNNIQKNENNFFSNEYTQKYLTKKQFKIQSQPTLQTKIVKLKIRTQQSQKQFNQQALRNSQSKQQTNENEYRILKKNSLQNKAIFYNTYNDTIQDSKFFQRTSLNMLIKEKKKKYLKQISQTFRNNQQIKLQNQTNTQFVISKKFNNRASMKFLPNFIKKVKINSYNKQKLFMSTARMIPSASINQKIQQNKLNFQVAGNQFLENHQINSCTLQIKKSLTQSNEVLPFKNSLKMMKIRKQTSKQNLDITYKWPIHNHSTTNLGHINNSSNIGYNNNPSNVCDNLSLKSFLFSKLT